MKTPRERGRPVFMAKGRKLMGEIPPGARASRPHNPWHRVAHLRHSDRPNGALALLRSGRRCSHRQGGCLRQSTEAQRWPKHKNAGGTPALPGVRLRAGRPRSRG